VNGYRPPGGYHALEYSAFSSSNVARPSLTPSELSSFTFGMELDYVFLLLYPTTLFLACRLLSRGFEESSRWRRIGHVLSLAMLTAIPSDLIDNISGASLAEAGGWFCRGSDCDFSSSVMVALEEGMELIGVAIFANALLHLCLAACPKLRTVVE